jgi:hypothetical protein
MTRVGSQRHRKTKVFTVIFCVISYDSTALRPEADTLAPSITIFTNSDGKTPNQIKIPFMKKLRAE